MGGYNEEIDHAIYHRTTKNKAASDDAAEAIVVDRISNLMNKIEKD